jgi:hypothetical protein
MLLENDPENPQHDISARVCHLRGDIGWCKLWTCNPLHRASLKVEIVFASRFFFRAIYNYKCTRAPQGGLAQQGLGCKANL